jgi:hypothetical protein
MFSWLGSLVYFCWWLLVIVAIAIGFGVLLAYIWMMDLVCGVGPEAAIVACRAHAAYWGKHLIWIVPVTIIVWALMTLGSASIRGVKRLIS